MAVEVTVWHQHRHRRSRVITEALVKGAQAAGYKVKERDAGQYRGPEDDEAPIAAMYGFHSELVTIFKDRNRTGRPLLFADMGYWARKTIGTYAGYHKLSLNSRHPTAYFQNRAHPGDRFHELRLTIEPWRKGGKAILLAGMGPKAAKAAEMIPDAWESETIAALRQVTDRPILYRPKPSYQNARPLKGAEFCDPRKEGLDAALSRAWAVVAHHSNTAIDGLLKGVPSFVVEGVATPLSLTDFAKIEEPWRPEGREQWAADLAYCQFHVAEIAEGKPWRHLREEGLIP